MTLDDFGRFADRLPWIVGGLMLLGLVVILLRAPSNLRKFREHQAQQMALRETMAARMGLDARAADPAQPLWKQALDSFVDGTEKVGPFPRFAVQPQVRVLFEGEKNRFATTVLVQRISQGDGPEIPDNVTTLVCFCSPDLSLPPFSLSPTIRMPALAEAALSAVAKVLKPLVNPDGPSLQEVDFDDPDFARTYTVRAAAPSSLSEGLVPRGIRDIFTPAVRAFLVTHAGWSVEGLKDRLLIYRDDVEEPAERMPAFLEEVLAVAERLRSPGA